MTTTASSPDTTAPGTTERAGRPDPRRWRVLALLGAAFFMTTLDATSVMAALPSLRVDLGLDPQTSAATISVYGLVFGGLLLTCGRAADRFGRRRMFLVGMTLRVVAALVCAVAGSAVALIAGRALLGLSAAVIAPSALSLLMRWFPDGPQRSRALGVWGALGGLGATSGLLLGGVLTQFVGWPAVFLVNVPVGVVVVVCGRRMLQESREDDVPPSMNLPSAFAVTAGLMLLVVTVVRLPESGTDAGTVAAGTGAVLAFTAFGLLERRADRPMIPARLLRSRSRSLGNATLLLAGVAVEGMLLVLTAHVQQTLHLPAVAFGGLAAAMTVTSVLGASLAQRRAGRRGPFGPIVVGAVVLAVAGVLLAAATTVGSLMLAVVALAVFGLGMSGAFVGGQVAALHAVPGGDSGVAAGITDTCFVIGNALGAALCASVMATAGTAAGFLTCTGAAFAVVVLAAVLRSRRWRTRPA